MELAKKKADKLVDKYIQNWNLKLSIEDAKECALIAVDEILKYQPYDIYTIEQCDNVNNYWEQVKQEINNL